MSFWLHESPYLYKIKVIPHSIKILALGQVCTVFFSASYFAFINPHIKKEDSLIKQQKALVLRQQELEKILVPIRMFIAGKGKAIPGYASTVNQCSRLFVAACVKHNLTCPSLSTSIRQTKKKISKCFLNAHISGNFQDFQKFLDELQYHVAVKIKSYDLNRTAHGISAECCLHFFLIPEGVHE